MAPRALVRGGPGSWPTVGAREAICPMVLEKAGRPSRSKPRGPPFGS